MDVRCEKCQAEYEFEDERVTEAGVAVKCTQCGHVFRVKKTSPPRAGNESVGGGAGLSSAPSPSAGSRALGTEALGTSGKGREWKVRQANGNLFSCKELTTLQKWIIERKVTRDDQISLTGENWKRLGDIGELASFFQVVEEAQQAQKLAALAQSGHFPAPAPVPSQLLTQGPLPPISPRGELPEEPAWVPKRSGTPWLVVLLLLIAAGGAGYYGYFHMYLPAQEEKAALARHLEEERAARAAEEKAALEARLREAEQRAAAAAADAGAPSDAGSVAAAPPADAGAQVMEAKAQEPAVKPASAEKPRGFDDWVSLGDRALQSDRPERALDMYDKALDIEPDRVEPLVGRGLAFLDMGKLQQAEASFTRALKQSPKFGEALMGLAETYQAMGKKDGAIQYYEKYLDVLPNGRDAEVARRAIRKLRD